jgi:hypothetical protein
LSAKLFLKVKKCCLVKRKIYIFLAQPKWWQTFLLDYSGRICLYIRGRVRSHDKQVVQSLIWERREWEGLKDSVLVRKAVILEWMYIPEWS